MFGLGRDIPKEFCTLIEARRKGTERRGKRTTKTRWKIKKGKGDASEGVYVEIKRVNQHLKLEELEEKGIMNIMIIGNREY